MGCLFENIYEKTKEGRRLAALLFSIGVVQIAAYYFSGAMVNGADSMAIAQPDSLLYMQAARRIVEGHPFSFSALEPVSTGTTSVLYPFVLAIPYALGATGMVLCTVGFWLNAAFYLIFLAGWFAAFRKWLPVGLPQLLGTLLLALLGQSAYAALAQSDVGLWMAISALIVAALAADRFKTAIALLIVAPWIRPEGMVFALALFFVCLCLRSRRAFAALLPVLSMVAIFAFNWMLTGEAQFSSVAHKGHFAVRPFAGAVFATACDLLTIARGLVFGAAVSPPRQFYMIPVVGAVLLWIGVFTHDWRGKRGVALVVVALATCGGVMTVASSGWQNTNVDRYLAWIMPLVALFMAEGLSFAVEKIRDLRLRSVAALAPVVFAVGGAVAFVSLFHLASRQSDQLVKFAEELDHVLPHQTSLGLTGYSGFAYRLGDRRVASLNGIYSPAFASKTLAGNMARLKHDPSLRFSYWLIAGDDKFADGFAAAQGRQLMVGPEGIEVRVADWSMFDNAARPHATGMEGLQEVGFVDVGDDASEEAAAYRVVTKYNQLAYEPFQRIDDLAGAKAYDCGRVVFGHDEMLVGLKAGKDLKIVLRTLPSVKVSVLSLLTASTVREFGFDSPLMVEVHVDGEEVAHCHVPIAEKGFSDIVLTVPGVKIPGGVHEIAFVGDHIACGYWFYQ
jgi:hypothetical protein